MDRPQALFKSFLRIASVRAAEQFASQIPVCQEIVPPGKKLSVGQIAIFRQTENWSTRT
jgi:hypothetical protein